MAKTGIIHHWINLIKLRFGRNKNLDGNYVAIEPSAIPTVTMLANWARNETPVSEVWIFGSATDDKSWDCLNDDLDVLMVVPDKHYTGETPGKICKEAPLSEHYIKTDIRVKSESACEPWLQLARLNQLASAHQEGEKESLVENVFRHGVCVWRRDSKE